MLLKKKPVYIIYISLLIDTLMENVKHNSDQVIILL